MWSILWRSISWREHDCTGRLVLHHKKVMGKTIGRAGKQKKKKEKKRAQGVTDGYRCVFTGVLCGTGLCDQPSWQQAYRDGQ